MEGVGLPIRTTAAVTDAAPPSSQPHDLGFSPAGSPEDSHLEEVPLPSGDHPSPAVTLTDDLRDKIIKQVEYYFSDENLHKDKFFMGYITKNKEGFVPVGVVASCKKIKKLTRDKSLIVAALRSSSLLVVSSDEKKVKRLHPPVFPEVKVPEVKDPELFTVLVENLPHDHSAENIQKLFGEAGTVKKICIHDRDVEDSRKRSVAEKLLSGKLYALVEYETVEAAENAVATLNDEKDWRYGMRVKLLKQRSKQQKKVWKEPNSNKNSNVQSSDPAGDEENHISSEHNNDISNLEKGEHLGKDKNGHRGQNRGRGRKQKNHGSNGQVLGHRTVICTHTGETWKPPPMPKMPDGTRGFTMGRGRPLPSEQS